MQDLSSETTNNKMEKDYSKRVKDALRNFNKKKSADRKDKKVHGYRQKF